MGTVFGLCDLGTCTPQDDVKHPSIGVIVIHDEHANAAEGVCTAEISARLRHCLPRVLVETCFVEGVNVNFETEAAVGARLARNFQRPAYSIDDAFADRQAQTCAAETPRDRRMRLLIGIEN